MGERKKWMENPIVGALVVPVGIVLVGALIVFGVAGLLQAEKTHHDLVRELRSKTFGNRWVSALELAKVISASGIPKEDIPRLLADLEDLYVSSEDARTRNFIVVAAGALKDPRALPLLERGLDDPSPDVSFRALSALGNMKGKINFDWSKIRRFLKSSDPLQQQAAIFTLATHKVKEAEGDLLKYLSHSNKNLRYASAIALANFKNSKAVPLLKEILLPEEGDQQDKRDRALALNVLEVLSANRWTGLTSLVQQVEQEAADLKVVSLARRILEDWGVKGED